MSTGATRDEGELRKLAREEPEAVRRVAERAGEDSPLGEWLFRLLKEEQGGDGR